MNKHNAHTGEEKAREEAQEGAEGGNPGPQDSPGENSAPEAEAGGAENAGKGPDEPGEAPAEEQIAALEAQTAELRDQYLRKAAEFENFRKRMNQEKQTAIDFANQSLLLDLIPIMDDFDRALKSGVPASGGAPAEEAGGQGFAGFYEGIAMIAKRLASQLENKWGLKSFDSAGEAFDPNRHEAIMMEKSAEAEEPVVLEEFLKGYTLKDRVIRSAKVKVLMPE
jgi:molecular chaperone GrpE